MPTETWTGLHCSRKSRKCLLWFTDVSTSDPLVGRFSRSNFTPPRTKTAVTSLSQDLLNAPCEWFRKSRRIFKCGSNRFPIYLSITYNVYTIHIFPFLRVTQPWVLLRSIGLFKSRHCTAHMDQVAGIERKIPPSIPHACIVYTVHISFFSLGWITLEASFKYFSSFL